MLNLKIHNLVFSTFKFFVNWYVFLTESKFFQLVSKWLSCGEDPRLFIELSGRCDEVRVVSCLFPTHSHCSFLLWLLTFVTHVLIPKFGISFLYRVHLFHGKICWKKFICDYGLLIHAIALPNMLFFMLEYGHIMSFFNISMDKFP